MRSCLYRAAAAAAGINISRPPPPPPPLSSICTTVCLLGGADMVIKAGDFATTNDFPGSRVLPRKTHLGKVAKRRKRLHLFPGFHQTFHLLDKVFHGKAMAVPAIFFSSGRFRLEMDISFLSRGLFCMYFFCSLIPPLFVWFAPPPSSSSLATFPCFVQFSPPLHES